ncbi:MAG: preprotein translocase subunit TatA [Sulfurovum sp. AS07-7]|nr:MAG: preprotein translocase subunit TatA [Sulfurovum sp. AS07-7]
MGSFSMGHWLVVLAVIVLLFGAKKIPELAKGLGKGIKDFKEAVKEEEKADDAKELTSTQADAAKSDKTAQNS